MNKGAHHVHEALRTELIRYLESQYFGRTEVLLKACHEQMTMPGQLYSAPYIESSPSYETVEHAIQDSVVLPDDIKRFFARLAEAGLGVYPTPFRHQLEALEGAWQGRDLFVSTGTGSGKTECFMWPMMALLGREAVSEASWTERGVRVVVMYPMNALVADQVGRLRRLMGDPGGRFMDAFHALAGTCARRPQFGMYTGRTPYPGENAIKDQDAKLANSLERLLPISSSDPYFDQLLHSGKIPAKADLRTFIDSVRNGMHSTSPMDAELITRFEMQKTCPDILITNYSMLEYMLLRSREDNIWDQTAQRLARHPEEKLLFVIDEAHMYRGSAGGEVALLLRRLMARLGIDRSRVQFVLTTASMPRSSHEDHAAVEAFAGALTSTDRPQDFLYLWGHQSAKRSCVTLPLFASQLAQIDLDRLDENEQKRLDELNHFRAIAAPEASLWHTMGDAVQWLYLHLLDYVPFQKLFDACRGTAVSMDKLALDIFPNESDATKALDVMLAIAPLGKDLTGSVLFPARMHMLFRGFGGVYACANADCPNGHEGNGLRLGDIFLNDSHLVCPACQSRVYEMFMDRRCGALYFCGYVEEPSGRKYLWTRPGAFFDQDGVQEMHFYLPMEGDVLPDAKKGGANYHRCYLDCHSGYIGFDDSGRGKKGHRELWWYSSKPKKGTPAVYTFATCPKCRQKFSHAKLTSFSTRGNQPFYNIIQTQFQEQPPASTAKEQDDRLPNDGRKILIFSDSRQKAAVLARDLSVSSDEMAIRKLFMIALVNMKKVEELLDEPLTLNDVYGYLVQEAARQRLDLFSDSRQAFKDDQQKLAGYMQSMTSHGRKAYPHKKIQMDSAPMEMQEHLLRLFCMSYNTLVDTGLCFLEPDDGLVWAAVEQLQEKGIQVAEEAFREGFSAISRTMLVDHMALGSTIREDWRGEVRRKYGNDDFGVADFDQLPLAIAEVLGCLDQPKVQQAWMDAMRLFMNGGRDNPRRFFLVTSSLHPIYDPKHVWYRCRRCSALSPYRLCGCCQVCGSSEVDETKDFFPEAFWREGVQEAMNGTPIRVIDTEEHTAQLGHKDQRGDLWAQTEQYEMRFQDMIKDGEKPIDILSSTTTMEVGIDIGSLVAVGLRNMPPMRENYQQRAGRAGRRGSSLSTIITYAEGGPHDAYYFKHPEPMFQGEPRKPWIDASSPKLVHRHLNLVLMNQAVRDSGDNLDSMSAIRFFSQDMDDFRRRLESVPLEQTQQWIPDTSVLSNCRFRLMKDLKILNEQISKHPDVYGAELPEKQRKSLLDALYEEGIIPTYSFPKDVVSTYIEDEKGNILQQVERGLDVAISEYAPGRAIVVDKKTYVIGGIYYHTEGKYNYRQTGDYLKDRNHVKALVKCPICGWFGFETDGYTVCPFCGNHALDSSIAPMLRPWGFSPLDGKPVASVSGDGQYSASGKPLYSTLPDESKMLPVESYQGVRMATLPNQRIIMLNTGVSDTGFTICCDCGAAVPGDNASMLKNVKRPGNRSSIACNHGRTMPINLGYDFLTDVLVLTFDLRKSEVATGTPDAREWLKRAATTLAEALRKATTILLDVEFNEIRAGYRVRQDESNLFADIYLYDSLSSGAGYCAQAGMQILQLLNRTRKILTACSCDHACQRCLKHYQNQRIQADLDRGAAVALLEYSQSGQLPDLPALQEKRKLIMSIQPLLESEGISVKESTEGFVLTRGLISKQLMIHPAMIRPKPEWRDAVTVTYEAMDEAKPHAVKCICQHM